MDYLKFLRGLIGVSREQWLDGDRILALQKERLTRVLEHAKRSAHYGPLLHGMSAYEAAQEPGSLPLTSKDDIRACPDSFLSDPGKKSSLRTLITSGTTGTPLTTYIDEDSTARRIAIRRVFETEGGLSPLHTYAEIGVKKVGCNRLLSSLGLFRRRSLSIYDSEERNFSQLRQMKADAIGLYVSIVAMMARMNELHGRPLKLATAFTAAETLTDGERRLIQDSFSCPVFEQYGLTEVGYVASECSQEHRMHIADSSIIVEIVDSKGRPKKSGKGEIVVTPLHNLSMPLVRYRTGDIGRWGKECSCGRSLPVLESIDGRVGGAIILPSGRHASPQAFLYMHGIPGFLSFQIVREKEDLFVFRYITKTGLPDASRKEIARRIKKACCGEDVSVEFEEVESISRGSTGKNDVLVSKVKGDRC